MNDVSTEKAVRNQIASARMEGFRFSREAVELIRKYTDSSISHDELLSAVSRICAKRA